MSTTNLEFDSYYKSQPLYGGCYSKNQLATKRPGGKFYVINMENSNAGSGTHWVCVFDCLPTVSIYYDPFGVDPPPDISKFMKRSGKKTLYSTDDFQELTSENCGRFVALFINKMLAHQKLGLTDHPSTKNERIVSSIKL